VGLEPTTTASAKHVLQPAVGLYSKGDEGLARVRFSTGIEPVAQVAPRPQTHWTEPMYSKLAVALLFSWIKPNEVVAETCALRHQFHRLDVVPTGSWAFPQRPFNEEMVRTVASLWVM
jgi:hypothetical protein